VGLAAQVFVYHLSFTNLMCGQGLTNTQDAAVEICCPDVMGFPWGCMRLTMNGVVYAGTQYARKYLEPIWAGGL